ncbi:hypothetical protein BN946_scf184791.g9 [Trametes cinnabarina]|uniref:DUF6534 domain-containing protein n=1 Tax=Pycnoporus cinnabarinus TaxID=5643 RepID=A0A060SAV8_PYCCI|nr:hypothetical protein BN946_scf184791.g9 [Trametes cinnabarina]
MSDLNVTVGALLIGVLVTAVYDLSRPSVTHKSRANPFECSGFGITTLQTYMYMNRFPKDPWYIHWTVWSLLVLDTSHIILSWHMTYYYLIINFNNPPALDNSVWSFNITVVVTAVITVIVHCFYARRVFILGNRSWTLVVLILSLSMVRLICGCIVTAKIFVLKKLALLPIKIPAEVGTGLGAGTLADIIITSSLVYFLHGHKSGFNNRYVLQLDTTLDKIIYWTVNNGLLTSVVGLVVIVTFSVMPDNMVFLGVHLLLSKLYANSLLATLNFRQAQRGRGLDTEGNSAINVTSTYGRSPRSRTTIQFSDMNSTTSSKGQSQVRDLVGEVAIAADGSTDASVTHAQGQVTTAPIVHVMTTTTTDVDYPLEDMSKGESFGPERLVANLDHSIDRKVTAEDMA